MILKLKAEWHILEKENIEIWIEKVFKNEDGSGKDCKGELIKEESWIKLIWEEVKMREWGKGKARW